MPAKRPPQKTPTPPEKLVEAAAHEDEIRQEAAAIRGETNVMDADLFMRLFPLLRKPIHEGHIEHVSAGDGKPYDSTGVRSVQVQHDRMNNVLTPLWWSEKVQYEQDGKLCHVTVAVLSTEGSVLLARSSYGGVDRGSTVGNVYKGSYTNAAKPAFARIGPGHEIYVGAVDLDPDVSEAAAKQQAKPDALPAVETINAEASLEVKQLFDQVCPPDEDLPEFKAFMDDFKVECGKLGIAGAKSVNDAILKLTPAQAAELSGWLAQQNGVAYAKAEA